MIHPLLHTVTTLRACPVCGLHAAAHLADLQYRTFDDSQLDGSMHLVSCATCGCAFNDTKDDYSCFDRYYQTNQYYYSTVTSGAGGCSSADLQRFSETAQVIKKHCQSTHSVIFDVGCGKGGLLHALQEYGYRNLYAIDPLPACVDAISSSTPWQAACGTTDNLPFPDVQPDCIVYSHLIEHAFSPRSALSTAWQRLPEGGLVYLELPDASAYGTSTTLPYEGFFMEHINHFDLDHLSMLMEACGFAEVACGEKLLHGSNKQITPCIYGMYRKKIDRFIEPRYCGSLTEKMNRFIQWSSSHPLNSRLQHIADCQKKLYIWGVSQYAQLLLGSTALGRSAIEGFIDRDEYKQTKTLMGISVHAPDLLHGLNKETVVLLIGSAYKEQMRACSVAHAFRGITVALDELEDFLWM